ncbi:MAG: hypothetical protein HFH68_03085 [Lachnospiraceae bacterium]|nr:hypothetical protein [Lachnospiraceae bacterium]
MTEVPHTYAEWVNITDKLKSRTNDEEILNAMKQGTIEWQTGVAERFLKKLADVINSRMNMASDKFQKTISRPNTEEREIVQALLALRKEMAFLADAVDLPALPENERSQYKQLVISQACKMQSSLEESARKDRSGKLLTIVRNHKVNKF